MTDRKSVYVFGNPDLLMDSGPLRILPRLQKNLPQIDFILQDPNEEWTPPPLMTIIDTVVGIDEPRVFESLADFELAPRLSVHDFDAYVNLRWLQKLGRIQDVRIIGLPINIDDNRAITFAVEILSRQ